MEILRKLISVMTIEEFADKHNLIMEVRERNVPENDPSRFYAQFKNSELTHGRCFLIGAYGNGATEEEAINNYIKEISQKTMVFNATDAAKRKEILVPRLKGRSIKTLEG